MSITMEVSDLYTLLDEQFNTGYAYAAKIERDRIKEEYQTREQEHQTTIDCLREEFRNLEERNKKLETEAEAEKFVKTRTILKLENLVTSNPSKVREVLQILFGYDKVWKIGALRELSKMTLLEAKEFIETEDVKKEPVEFEDEEPGSCLLKYNDES